MFRNDKFVSTTRCSKTDQSTIIWKCLYNAQFDKCCSRAFTVDTLKKTCVQYSSFPTVLPSTTMMMTCLTIPLAAVFSFWHPKYDYNTCQLLHSITFIDNHVAPLVCMRRLVFTFLWMDCPVSVAILVACDYRLARHT